MPRTPNRANAILAAVKGKATFSIRDIPEYGGWDHRNLSAQLNQMARRGKLRVVKPGFSKPGASEPAVYAVVGAKV